MNCAKHTEVQATAFCRSCGKALCDACQTKSQGTVFCEEHRPMDTNAIRTDPIYGRPEYSPYTAPAPPPMSAAMLPPIPPQQQPLPGGSGASSASGQRAAVSASPGLAFILGWIPGVGAIYNGQYAKGLVHVVVFGLLVSVLDRGGLGGFEPLFGIGLAAWIFYMAFEAYHTAKKRMLGIPVDEFSSLMHFDASSGRLPVGPMVLIGLGVFFLLTNFNLISVEQVLRFWPLALIGFGLYMLMGRMSSGRRP